MAIFNSFSLVITRGYIQWDFSQERVHLPLKLRELSLGTSFNQSLENVTFPSELVSLTFGASFNQPLQSLAPKSTGVPSGKLT